MTYTNQHMVDAFNRDAGTSRHFYEARDQQEIDQFVADLPPDLKVHLESFRPLDSDGLCRVKRVFPVSPGAFEFPAEVFLVERAHLVAVCAIDLALIRLQYVRSGWDHVRNFILCELNAFCDGLNEEYEKEKREAKPV